jgi:hypothetical protein
MDNYRHNIGGVKQMFNWFGNLFRGIGDVLDSITGGVINAITDVVWDVMLRWIFNVVYGAIASLFNYIGNFGIEIFDLPWVSAILVLFYRLGWTLFIVGMIVAIFDLAIESQNGRGNIKTTCLNILKGFVAVNLITVLPIELYRFAVSLQFTFAGDLTRIFTTSDGSSFVWSIGLRGALSRITSIDASILFALIAMIALVFCIVKVFFDNLKRGGIIVVMIAVGSLYMLSIPRGYTDGFNAWCRQVVALCLTTFLQMTLLFLGLLTFPDNLILGIGIMMAASDVPRIAGQFGLDSSTKVNMAGAASIGATAMNLTRTVTRAAA